jgi:hypothetical protein
VEVSSETCYVAGLADKAVVVCTGGCIEAL